MVRVSGEEKIEGIIERLSVMKQKEEKIDLALERNAAEQLGDVDWDGLNAAISSRIDKASQSQTSAIRYPIVFKIAAGMAAAAAVVLIAVMVKTEEPTEPHLENGRSAVVKFIERKGSALVEIKGAGAKSSVFVDIGRSGKRVAKCDVKIIDLNGDLKKESDEAAWIIISRPAPVLANNGYSRDVMSMICLF